MLTECWQYEFGRCLDAMADFESSRAAYRTAVLIDADGQASSCRMTQICADPSVVLPALLHVLS